MHLADGRHGPALAVILDAQPSLSRNVGRQTNESLWTASVQLEIRGPVPGSRPGMLPSAP
jgi:hypothetical protein